MPNLQLSDGSTVPVEGTNFVIGADPVCDLSLQDEGVAPRHAILQFDDDVWRLATLSLQSETKLNGEAVESIVALQDGDELALGSASLKWLEQEPVKSKRFPVWVPVVLLFFACVTVLGLWNLFNRDDYTADRLVTSPTTAEEVALATQQAEEASVMDARDDESSSSSTSDGNTTEDGSSVAATPTPVHLKAPVPTETPVGSDSAEVAAADEMVVEIEAEAEPACPPPEDWVQMTVEAGQKVKDIAKIAGTTPRKVKDANCLPSYNISAGDILWVPYWEQLVEDAGEAPTEAAQSPESGEGTEVEESNEAEQAAESTETDVATEAEEVDETEEGVESIDAADKAEEDCSVPDGWVQTTVEAGQRVKDIAEIAGTTPRKVKDANCLPSYNISAGDILWVPYTEPDVGEEVEADEDTESASATAEIQEAIEEVGEAAVAAVTEIIEEVTDSIDATSADGTAESGETDESCPVPDGWVQVTVETGQRVKDIAEIAGTTPRKVKDANCLPNYKISAGDMLWVPQREPDVGDGVEADEDSESASATAEIQEAIEEVGEAAVAAVTEIIEEVTDSIDAISADGTAESGETDESCPVPDGWVQVTVETGQRVKDIAKIAGTTPRKVKDANCLPNYKISAGDILWVPQREEAEDVLDTAVESDESAKTTAATEAETEESCPVPDGWEPATIEEDMKLKDLAEILGSKARVIKEGNCLPSYKVTPGQVIWVPISMDPLEKDEDTAVDDITKCPYPDNWVQMTVQKGQKLRDIAHEIGVQPWEIKVANCLPDTKVRVGMILWVPRWGGKG